MTSLDLAESPPKFHLSLNVSDLNRSVEFYRVLFGTAPAKHHDDYAKFEPDGLGLVFSLVPHAPAAGGSLSHLGLRVPDAAAIQEIRQRLEAAGIATQTQENTVCGYARQNKCWVADPDRNFWEVYTVEEDLAPAEGRPALEAEPAKAAPSPVPLVWEHGVTHPLPDRIPHADATLDEVRLVGSFNGPLGEGACLALVREAWRVLRPGGKILVHGLAADRPFPRGQPSLPGLAAMVSRLPLQTEPVQALKAAGFAGIQFVKLSEQPWFRHDGVELREVKVIGWKPARPAEGEVRQVLYRGPFREAADDLGNVYPRGRQVAVSAAAGDLLRQGPAAEQFLFFDQGAESACPPCN
jgi:catechol 2,3-dioxygenase-like lactoylglutathione lyase family enzyme